MLPMRPLIATYLAALEQGNTNAVAALLHADAELVEHPNRLNPTGKHYDRAAIVAANARGAALMASQRYELRALTIEGDRAVAQIAWTGEVRGGPVMRAQICSVIELRDGTLWRLEQYDCFEP